MDAKHEAMKWLHQQLTWERRLAELRARYHGAPVEADEAETTWHDRTAA